MKLCVDDIKPYILALYTGDLWKDYFRFMNVSIKISNQVNYLLISVMLSILSLMVIIDIELNDSASINFN